MEIKIFDQALEGFLTALGEKELAKALRTIDLLETFGNKLGMPHARKISADIFELRVRGKREIRIFYTFHKRQVVLLSGFIKKTDKTPAGEIRVANKKRLTLI